MIHVRGTLGHLQATREKGEMAMALTRDFKETIRARAPEDAKYREALLVEATETLLAGDFATAKTFLRDFINATIGFEQLGHHVNKSPKSVMRMLSPKGNPRTENLIKILSCLQQREGVHFKVMAVH